MQEPADRQLGHQTPILTNRSDLRAAETAHRTAARWRQENYFKYAREHFALDALDSYADHDDDPTRQVPNPAKARALTKVGQARADITAAHALVSEAIQAATIQARQSGNGGKATVYPTAQLALTAAESALARLLRPHYSRGDHEARALLREAFTLPGDLQIIDDTLHVRLDAARHPDAAEPSPPSAPNSPIPPPATPPPT